MSRPDYRMTETERAAFVATLSDWQRHDADRLVRETERSVTRWMGYGDTLDNECFRWALLIVDHVTDQRVSASSVKDPEYGTLKSWDDVMEILRGLVEAKSAEDLDEDQAWFDEDPAEYTNRRGADAVVFGTVVVHPWREMLTDIGTLFDLLTPYFVWQVWTKCLSAGTDCLRESLSEYAGGDDRDASPAKAVTREFKQQMKALDKRLEAIRPGKTALAA